MVFIVKTKQKKSTRRHKGQFRQFLSSTAALGAVFSILLSVSPAAVLAASAVNTNSATNITEKTATLNGSVQGASSATGRGFEFGKDGDFSKSTSDPEYTFDSQTGTPKNADGQFDDPVGVATDSSNNLYVVDSRNFRVQKFDSDGNFISKFGESGSGDGQFYVPYGVTIDSNNNVYVSDQNSRVQKFDSDGNFISKFGESGSGDGQFSSPKGIEIDSSGKIYVVDQGNSRVQKFDSDGNFISKFGESGSGDGQFSSPNGLTTDSNNNIYVADTNNHRIQKFDSDGNFISKFGSYGTNDGQFISYDVTTDSSDNVLVADVANRRIQKFNSSGVFISKWGSAGTGDGQFNSPQGITTDNTGAVYVGDTNNNRVQKFDSSGNFIDTGQINFFDDGNFSYPNNIIVDSAGNTYVADTGNSRIQKFDSDGNFISKFGESGSGDGQFSLPRGIAIDSSGKIYVVDQGNHRIQKFSSSGVFISKWGSNGSGNGEFSQPNSISIDSNDSVYVADTNNNRVQKFNTSGGYVSQFGGSGSENGQLSGIYGVTTDSNNNIYVADYGNNRIQKFDSDGNFISKFGESGSGDGQFSSLTGVMLDTAGNIFVVDAGNYRIQKFDSSGGYITQFGSRDDDHSGTGNGKFGWQLQSAAIDATGNVYVADSGNNIVQKFAPVPVIDGAFAKDVNKLKCNTTYTYRAYVIEGGSKAYGNTQSFKTSSCTSADLKLSIALDEPGLSEGESGSYTLKFSNIGNSQMSGVIYILLRLPDNVTISGGIQSIPGLLDGGCENTDCYLLMTDPAKDALGDLFESEPINPGESFSVTIPVNVSGPVDENTTLKAAALDYIMLAMGGEIAGESETMEIFDSLEELGIEAVYGLSYNNIASYSGIIAGSSDPIPAGGVDTDNDSISDAIENAAPNNGDGNNDGTPDSEQSHVTSLPNAGGSYVTVVLPVGTVVSSTTIQQMSDLSSKDTEFVYPLGLVSFTATTSVGATVPVQMFFYTGLEASQFTARKFNSTKETYDTMPGVALANENLANQQVIKLSYTVTDGGNFDEDGVANGTIVDPVGLGTKTGNPVDALAETGLNIFALMTLSSTLLLLGLGFWRISKRSIGGYTSR